MSTLTHSVVIAIGSNLRDSAAEVRQAIERMKAFSDQPLLVSSLWQTAPVDCPPGSPMFVNAIVALVPRTTETPESLLGKLKRLEQEFGRKPKTILNEPRPLDLDLVVFGAETRATEALVVPHPRAHLRGFVLQPLSEIAPDLVLPGQTKTVSQLLGQLTSGEAVRKLE